MPDAPQPTDGLPPGFYWVQLDGLPPEVARRDADAGEWLLAGVESGIGGDHPALVVVLGGPLAAPT